MPSRRVAPILALPLLLAAVPAAADTLRARYGVSLLGLPLGTATLAGTIGLAAYSVEANARLSGLASLVTRSQGGATAAGALAGGRTVPATYATTASNSETTRTVRMAMAGGAVKGIDIAPPFEDRPGRVPLTDASKRNVVDPLSALVMAVPGTEPVVGPAACDRTLPVFDGYTRFDVALSFVGTRTVQAKGYAGPVAVCAARYTPLAGHRPAREATRFMAANRNLEAWLAPVGDTRVVVPFRISVKTMIGTTVIEAEEFAVERTQAAR